ncbi:hypothetical protein Tco_0150407 [Tanacetum coccineum]
MDSNLNNENDQWELSLDIDDSDLRLTLVLTPCSSTRVETSTPTQKPVRIIPGPAGIVQAAKLLKQKDILLGRDGDVISTQEYMKKVVEDVSEDEDFKRDIENFFKNGKLDQVVAIVKSCSPNVIGDLIVTMKDLSVFTLKPSMHYLNITMRNVVKVFRKDTIPESGSG